MIPALLPACGSWFKADDDGADPCSMSTGSQAPGARFRRATIVQSSPEEQLKQLLGDGPRMYAIYEDRLRELGLAGDLDGILRLARIADGAHDEQRAYAAQRLAAAVLLAMAEVVVHDEAWSDALPLDRTIELLVPALERRPHEPELLLQLGDAVLQLGDVELARRVFGAVATLEPEHEGLANRRSACSAVAASSAPSAWGAGHAPLLERSRSAIEVLLERAVDVPAQRISLCMIVRDEEEMLPRSLDAVRPFVDELIIVDTGSVDRTREIATERGATVVDFAWNGSFSDARNESLRHATGDWILWLDADEVLVADDGPQLRDLARRTWVEGWHVVEHHLLDDDGSAATHAPMRLFRRRAQHAWRGAIHEQVAWSLPTWLEGRVRRSTVRIDHFGYQAQVVVDRGKQARNLALLEAELERERTAFTCFNIGTEHASQGDWAEARRWYEQSLSLATEESGDWRTQPWAPLLVQRTLIARRTTGDLDVAITLADEALEWWPDYTDLIFERASARLAAGDAAGAIIDATLALECGDAPARYVSVTGKGTFQARHLRADARRRSGDVDGARDDLEQVVRTAPHYVVALGDLTSLLLEQGGELADLDSNIDELLGDRSHAVAPNMVVGTALHRANEHDAADARFRRVLDVVPAHGAALVARAELQLARHEFEVAWALGLQLDPLDPLAPAGATTAFIAAAVLERPDLVTEPASRIAAGASLPASARAVYVAWAQLVEAGDAPLDVIVPIDPIAIQTVLSNLEALGALEAAEAFEVLHALVPRVLPDPYERQLQLARVYLRLGFADMAGEELLALAQEHGADADILTGLGKVATLKHLWEDAEVFLSESLQLDPGQHEARSLLDAVRERIAG
jgi:tetratricopeptide (TPR) repeat protein